LWKQRNALLRTDILSFLLPIFTILYLYKWTL
jgi:hypothetical protein